ncbi:MAG: radical SAM protein [bacterium]
MMNRINLIPSILFIPSKIELNSYNRPKKGEVMKVVAYIFVGFVGGFGNPCQNFIWEDLKGKPVLLHIIDRLKIGRKITDIIPYTHLWKEGEEDKKALELAERYGLKLYFIKTDRWESMLEFQKNIGIEDNDILFIPINSPLIDPEIVDFLVEKIKSLEIDYMWTEGFPEGIGTELWKADIWHKFCEIDPKGIFLRITGGHHSFAKTSTLFKKYCVKAENIWNKLDLNLSIDSSKQLSLMRKIYDRFYKEGEIVDTKEVLRTYEEEPEFFEVLHRDQIEIELTNDCNLNCIICPRTSKMTRETGYMDFDLFKKIIDETSASSVHFSGLGEPLLHPNVLEMFAYAKDKGLEVGLWTNGLNLDEKFSRDIIEKGLLDYIILGLDAATKETYAKIKGVDLFDKAVYNITKFLELKRELLKDAPRVYGTRKPLVGIQIVKMKENEAEIEQFMERWDFQEKAKKMINYRNGVQQKDSRVNVELWETLYEKFLPVEYAIIGHFNNFCGQIEDRSVVDVTPLKRFPCKQLKAGLSVLWNGDAVHCRQDFNGEYSFGNLKGQALEEIIESKRLKGICQIHKNKNYKRLPLCANCKEWYYNIYA